MHIKNTLPDIKARISSSLQKYSAELGQLGDSMLGNSANIVLQIITEFCNEYRTVLDGNNQELSSVELSGGARISFVFHELYSNGVKAVDPFDQVKDIDIRHILYNSSGSSPALFVGTTAFELIVKQQIKRLEDPSLKCVSLVYDELVRILTHLLNKPLFRRYPSLKEKCHAVVINFFKKVLDPTNKLVKDLVAMESCYINTGHPDFLNGHRVGGVISQIRCAINVLPTQDFLSSSARRSSLAPSQINLTLSSHRPWQSSTIDTMQVNRHKSTRKRADLFLHRQSHLVLQARRLIYPQTAIRASSGVSLLLRIRRRWPPWIRPRLNLRLRGLYQKKKQMRLKSLVYLQACFFDRC